MNRAQERHGPPRRDDPFEGPPGIAATGLEAGWLVDEPSAADAEMNRVSPVAAAWRPRRVHGLSSRRASRFWRPPHPLEGSPLFQGLSESDRKLLRRAFRSSVAPRDWASETKAKQHLASLFPSWPVVHWRQIRGPHLFLGATGAGKTTLLFKAARQLVARGRSVWAVALGPPDRARQAVFAAHAAESGISAAFVQDAAELRRVLSRSGPDEAVLFDTPCLIGHAPWLLGALQHPWLRHPHTTLHLCHSLQHSQTVQDRVVHLARRLHCDFRALAHVDLARGIAPLLALQLRQPRPLSFANASASLQAPPLPFDPMALLAALENDSSD